MCTTLSSQILSSHFLFDPHKDSMRTQKQIFLPPISGEKTDQSFAQDHTELVMVSDLKSMHSYIQLCAHIPLLRARPPLLES